jgi:hypothetical protein
MLHGEISISHEALDEHDTGQATAYLRSWLVATGILKPREERLVRFERWARQTLGAIGEHPDHAHVAAYAHWGLQPPSPTRSAEASRAPAATDTATLATTLIRRKA